MNELSPIYPQAVGDKYLRQRDGTDAIVLSRQKRLNLTQKHQKKEPSYPQ